MSESSTGRGAVPNAWASQEQGAADSRDGNVSGAANMASLQHIHMDTLTQLPAQPIKAAEERQRLQREGDHSRDSDASDVVDQDDDGNSQARQATSELAGSVFSRMLASTEDGAPQSQREHGFAGTAVIGGLLRLLGFTVVQGQTAPALPRPAPRHRRSARVVLKMLLTLCIMCFVATRWAMITFTIEDLDRLNTNYTVPLRLPGAHLLMTRRVFVLCSVIDGINNTVWAVIIYLLLGAPLWGYLGKVFSRAWTRIYDLRRFWWMDHPALWPVGLACVHRQAMAASVRSASVTARPDAESQISPRVALANSYGRVLLRLPDAATVLFLVYAFLVYLFDVATVVWLLITSSDCSLVTQHDAYTAYEIFYAISTVCGMFVVHLFFVDYVVRLRSYRAALAQPALRDKPIRHAAHHSASSSKPDGVAAQAEFSFKSRLSSTDLLPGESEAGNGGAAAGNSTGVASGRPLVGEYKFWLRNWLTEDRRSFLKQLTCGVNERWASWLLGSLMVNLLVWSVLQAIFALYEEDVGKRDDPDRFRHCQQDIYHGIYAVAYMVELFALAALMLETQVVGKKLHKDLLNLISFAQLRLQLSGVVELPDTAVQDRRANAAALVETIRDAYAQARGLSIEQASEDLKPSQIAVILGQVHATLSLQSPPTVHLFGRAIPFYVLFMQLAAFLLPVVIKMITG